MCRRDFWNGNIFYNYDNIIAIDWDITGFGYFGEDIASLVADETDPTELKDYFVHCVSTYQK
jgi:hypothetical protein